MHRFCLDNPPDKKYCRKKLVCWANFRRRHGNRISTFESDRCKPYMERQFIIRCTDKLGLSEADAQGWWKEFKADPHIRRDTSGFKGQQVLYIPIGKMHVKESGDFIENVQEEGGKDIKNPTDKDRQMLRDHVKRQRDHINFSDDFFDGLTVGKRRAVEGEFEDGKVEKPKPVPKSIISLPTEIAKTHTKFTKVIATLKFNVSKVLRVSEQAFAMICELPAIEKVEDRALRHLVNIALVRHVLLVLWEGSSAICVLRVLDCEEPARAAPGTPSVIALEGSSQLVLSDAFANAIPSSDTPAGFRQPAQGARPAVQSDGPVVLDDSDNGPPATTVPMPGNARGGDVSSLSSTLEASTAELGACGLQAPPARWRASILAERQTTAGGGSSLETPLTDSQVGCVKTSRFSNSSDWGGGLCLARRFVGLCPRAVSRAFVLQRIPALRVESFQSLRQRRSQS